MLREIEYKPSYDKSADDIASVFYIPSLKRATKYDRVSGYFGSTIYIIAWAAMKEFISNRGRMRLICSPILSKEDQDAINRGYESKKDEIVYAAIMREVSSIFEQEMLSAPHKLLAYFIAKGIVDIKIAIVGDHSSSNIRRLFHDKVGVFYDDQHNIVGFRGSMNETYKGLAPDGNIESIDVFPNWADRRDRIRAEEAACQFEELWTNSVHGVTVLEFPEAAKSIMRYRVKDDDWIALLKEVSQDHSLEDKWCADERPGKKRPRPHQVNALEKWELNDKRGILEHATGSGKTYTALCAIRSELEQGRSVLILVPSIDLLNQWVAEIRENVHCQDMHMLLCGGGNGEWRKDGVLRRWTQCHPHQKTIVLSTMDTAATDTFISNIVGGEHLFVVADEVHRLGSNNRRKILNVYSGARLALSATPRRYGDPEGTRVIMDYFGTIIDPPFTLRDAIEAKVLTRYFYFPLTTNLTVSEQDEWDALTKEISIIMARMQGCDLSDLERAPGLKMKLIARARILKNAEAKAKSALEIIAKNYKQGQKWIVYCDNQRQLREVLSLLMANGYDAFEYHSDMIGDRAQTLAYFSDQGGILVSIRCLDEGVDIPSTTHALILASSQNPREFIQRRGRILRKAPNKHFAYLYDVLVLPNQQSNDPGKEVSIVEAELARAIRFGEMAENPSCIATLKNIAVDYNIDIDTAIEGGVEDGEE